MEQFRTSGLIKGGLKKTAGAGALVLAFSGAALAHSGHGDGLLYNLLHWFFEPDHLLMIGVAMLATWGAMRFMRARRRG